jgi:putative peptidoglycan lipid II flippase
MLNFRKVGILTIINFAGLLLNIIYYILQVSYFGISREIENYFTAIGLCGLALSFTIVGHIGQMALPIYLEKKEKNGERIADDFFRVLFNWVIIFSLVITTLFFICSPFIIKIIVPGFESADHQVINSIFRILIITIPLQVANVLFGTLLNANKIYGRLEMANLIRVPLSIIILTLLFDRFGLYTLVICYVLESCLFFFLNLVLIKQLKFNYRLTLNSSHFELFPFLQRSSSAYLRNGAREFYLFILTASISFLPIGVFALYKYTESIFQKISSLVLRPVQTIFFTTFANDHAKNKTLKVNIISEALQFSWLYAIIVISFCSAFGKDILGLLWSEHFQTADQHLAFSFLLFHIFSLIFFSAQVLFVRVALVYNQIFSIYISLAVSWAASAIFCYFTIKYFNVNGLKASIIFTPLLAALSTFFVLYRVNKQLRKILNLKYFSKLLFTLIISSLLGIFIDHIIGTIRFLGHFRIDLFLSLLLKSIIFSFVILAQLSIFNLLAFLQSSKDKPLHL